MHLSSFWTYFSIFIRWSSTQLCENIWNLIIMSVIPYAVSNFTCISLLIGGINYILFANFSRHSNTQFANTTFISPANGIHIWFFKPFWCFRFGLGLGFHNNAVISTAEFRVSGSRFYVGCFDFGFRCLNVGVWASNFLTKNVDCWRRITWRTRILVIFQVLCESVCGPLSCYYMLCMYYAIRLCLFYFAYRS